MKTSEKGINLIKKFEGCKLTAYKCPAGVWTIGYGHTRNVHKGERIMQQQADELLAQDLIIYEKGINSIKLNINQNQFDALVSFCYNVGFKALQKSTLLKMIKTNPNNPKIKDEFLRWSYAGVHQLRGLMLRRRAEADLYFSNN